jgi:hypothetical protein
MGMIKELYDFVSEKGLELHTHVHNGQHRIVILWPDGCQHSGSVMNLEVCEAVSEDPGKASEDAFRQAVKRYAELTEKKSVERRENR